MTNPNTWTSNAMQVGVANADPDVADENLEYLKYELDNMNLTQGVEFVKNLIGNQDTDTDHDINFARVNTNYNAEVLVRDSSYNVRPVTYASEMTKQIDATWAAGDDAGGLDDNDTLASGQCLYGFLLCKSSDNSIDFGFTDDVTGASLLTDAAVIAAGFDEISVVPIHYLPPLDASSNIIGHITKEISGGGIIVRWKFASATMGIQELYSTGDASATNLTITCPPNQRPILNLVVANNGWLAVIDKNNNVQYGGDGAKDIPSGGEIITIYADSNKQIQYLAGDAPSYYYIRSNGFIAERRP